MNKDTLEKNMEFRIMEDSLAEVDAKITAKTILSLVRDSDEQELTEFVAVNGCQCSNVNDPYHFNVADCPHCHGTGRIERRLTVKEVMEWAKRVLNSGAPFINGSQTLPSGERVEIRKRDAK